MIKRLTFSLLLTCLYVPCFSQERFVVRGRILDAESAPVPYCSVSILESRDSTILGGAVSDTEGRYSEVIVPEYCTVMFQELVMVSVAPPVLA